MLEEHLLETLDLGNDISKALCKQEIESGAKEIKMGFRSYTFSMGKETKYVQKKYFQAANAGSK